MERLVEWIKFKDIVMPYLKTSRAGHAYLAKAFLYALYTRERPLTYEELLARAGEGASLEPDEKNFLHQYYKKLRLYGLVREVRHEGKVFVEPTIPAVPVELVQSAVERNAEPLSRFLKKRTLQAYRRGERFPKVLFM